MHLGRCKDQILWTLQTFFVSSHQTQKKVLFIPTILLSLFSRLLTYTNPTTLMDARQWTLTLP